MPNPEYLPATALPEFLDALNRATSRALVPEPLPAGWANVIPPPRRDPEPILIAPDEWVDIPTTTDWADIPVYADPVEIPRRSSRPVEDFVPTPPAYDFESDPRNTYDH